MRERRRVHAAAVVADDYVDVAVVGVHLNFEAAAVLHRLKGVLEQVADEYGDSISVFAVHSYLLVEETAAAYIADNYTGSSLNFLSDYPLEDGNTSGYYTTLGGRGTYPYTVVLDAEGVITKIFVSSVTYDMLKSAVEDALNN